MDYSLNMTTTTATTAAARLFTLSGFAAASGLSFGEIIQLLDEGKIQSFDHPDKEDKILIAASQLEKLPRK